MRPSHLAALNVLARLSGAPLHNAVGDAHVSWTPGDKGVQWGMVKVDAGTGGEGLMGSDICWKLAYRTPQDDCVECRATLLYLNCLVMVGAMISFGVKGQTIPCSLRGELHSHPYLQFGQALASFRHTIRHLTKLSAERC